MTTLAKRLPKRTASAASLDSPKHRNGKATPSLKSGKSAKSPKPEKASKSAKPLKPPKFDLAAYRARAEKATTEITEEQFRTHSGLSDGSRLTQILAKYDDLFDEAHSDAIHHLIAAAGTPRDKRRLRALYKDAVFAQLSRPLNDKFIQVQTMPQTVELPFTNPETAEATTITPTTAYMLSLNDPNRETREAATKLLTEFRRDQLNPVYEDLHREMHKFPKAHGYKNFIDLMEKHKGYSFADLAKVAKQFIRETDDVYRETLTYYLKTKLGLSLDKAKYHDAAMLFRAPEYDALFPKDAILEIIFGFIRQMGLDPTAKGRIVFDLEPRSNKNPRQMCYPIRVPNKIGINVMPRGGVGDYYAVMEELGHALHFAHTSPDTPYEFRYPMENSLTETYSYTIARLMLNPLWLMKVMKIADPDPFLHHKAFLDLFITRRYFAKFLYELKLHKSGSLAGKDDAYQETLGKVLIVPIVKENYLADVDAFFTVTSYVQAFLAHAEVHSKLRSLYGEDWFINPQTGGFLKELWAGGNEMTVSELGKKMGFGGLTATPLVKVFRGILDRNLNSI
ncbi:MAG: hypothetical protein IAF08_11170 [Rhizobacter sp.]|nr:hypothetical protein [Chlorobiales bacterium]